MSIEDILAITAIVGDDLNWMADGRCRDSDPELWYPEKRGNNLSVAAAKRTCLEECPVRNRCLDFALAYDEQWGIWGGVNMGQTRQRHRNQMRAERGVNLLTHTLEPWLPPPDPRRRPGDAEETA